MVFSIDVFASLTAFINKDLLACFDGGSDGLKMDFLSCYYENNHQMHIILNLHCKVHATCYITIVKGKLKMRNTCLLRPTLTVLATRPYCGLWGSYSSSSSSSSLFIIDPMTEPGAFRFLLPVELSVSELLLDFCKKKFFFF